VGQRLCRRADLSWQEITQLVAAGVDGEGMTSPRQVIKGRTYMLTRRCSERRFFLRPSDETNNAYVYCFAVAAQRYSVDVYWLSTMSNHAHPGLHDRLGNYPEFIRYFHSLVARCLNARLGRWENFWATEQTGVLHLPDGDTIFEKMIYALCGLATLCTTSSTSCNN
jgi:putative transposase